MAEGVIRRRPSVEWHPDWKEKVSAVLRDCGLIHSDYHGQIELNIKSGGVSGGQNKESMR